VRPGDHLDRLGKVAVPGDRAQLMPVGAHHVGQDMRVAGVALGPGHTAALPVTGHLQRIDRIHQITGREQRLYPRPPLGLDPDHDLDRLAVLAHVLAHVLTDHRVQPGDPRDPLRKPGLAQPPTGPVLDLHIVVILSPVISDQQQQPDLQTSTTGHARQPAEELPQPNDQVLTPPRTGTTSHQRSTLPTTGKGHDLSVELNVLGGRVLTYRRLPDPSLHQHRPVSTH
jgi:hypothetical protein